MKGKNFLYYSRRGLLSLAEKKPVIYFEGHKEERVSGDLYFCTTRTRKGEKKAVLNKAFRVAPTLHQELNGGEK